MDPVRRPKKPLDRRQADRRRRQNAIDDERRGHERRTTTRRKIPRVDLEIWVEEHRGTDRYLRRTRNLSEAGVFFDVALPSPVGSEVTLEFTLPGDPRPIVAHGEVVSSGSGPDHLGMGVRFTRVEDDGARRIRALVQAAAGQG